MNTSTLNLETGVRPRMAKSLVSSVGAHLLLCLWFAMLGSAGSELDGLTEITWIDPFEPAAVEIPGVLQSAEASPPMRTVEMEPPPGVPRVVSSPPVPAEKSVSPPLEAAPALFDIEGRMASLRNETTRARPQALSVTTSSSQPRPATVARGPGPSRGATELVRHGDQRRPLELRRTPAGPVRPTMALPEVGPSPVAPAVATEAESAARRSLAGASLVGPVAQRALESYTKPVYPEWASREAVEASVTIYFIVLPSGVIKRSVQIQKTSGFEDFDQNALDALMKWRFVSLPGDVAGEQWGLVTFHYRLTDP